MSKKWTDSQIKLICYLYKKYHTHFTIKILSHIVLDNIKHIPLYYLGKAKTFPSQSAVERMLRRCTLFQTSKQHCNIWNSVNVSYIANMRPSHDDFTLYNRPIYSGEFILANDYKTRVRVIGSAYVNGQPLPIENIELFEMSFEMLPYIMNKIHLEYLNKNWNKNCSRKLVVIDEFNRDKTPKVVEIYTYTILPKKNDEDPFIITNLRKRYQYDSLKTYCQFTMDSIVQLASYKCGIMPECEQDDFVTYVNSIKERIETDDNKIGTSITENEISEFIDILTSINIQG